LEFRRVLFRSLGSVVGREVVVEQELAEHETDADVRERAKREDAMRRADQPVDLRVVLLDLLHDAPDRLVDEREPDLLGAGHQHRIVRAQSRRAARQATCTATRTSSAAKSRRRVRSASDSARKTPPWAVAAAATPVSAAAGQRTFP